MFFTVQAVYYPKIAILSFESPTKSLKKQTIAATFSFCNIEQHLIWEISIGLRYRSKKTITNSTISSPTMHHMDLIRNLQQFTELPQPYPQQIEIERYLSNYKLLEKKQQNENQTAQNDYILTMVNFPNHTLNLAMSHSGVNHGTVQHMLRFCITSSKEIIQKYSRSKRIEKSNLIVASANWNILQFCCKFTTFIYSNESIEFYGMFIS